MSLFKTCKKFDGFRLRSLEEEGKRDFSGGLRRSLSLEG